MTPVPVALGFKPGSHGFAWIAFSSPLAVHDWGVVEARGEKNGRCLDRFERLLARLAPHTLVLEGYDDIGSRLSPRVVRLYRAVVTLARDKGIEIVIVRKNDVRACFASVGARTSHEIAACIARSFDMLRDHLPQKRQAWEGPHRRMGIFDAAAVVLTHYQLGTSQLFDDLKEERIADENRQE
jgi:hypothetical protein